MLAEDLWVGAQVSQLHAGTGVVESISFALRPQRMYNLTVAQAHTFFVGLGQWLVHNACGVQPFEVGFSDDLAKNSTAGDGLQIHHAPQKQPAYDVIPGYNEFHAPAIALPDGMHRSLNPTNLRSGAFTGSPRDLLAKTIHDLREIKVPNDALWKLIELNKTAYSVMR